MHGKTQQIQVIEGKEVKNIWKLRNILVHNHREEDLSTNARTRLVMGLKINSLGQYTN